MVQTSDGGNSTSKTDGNVARIQKNYFGKLKYRLRADRLHNSEEVEVDIREWLVKQAPDFYRDEIFQLVSRWEKMHRC